MARSYRGVRPKKYWIYDVEQIMALYGVCRNTVTNWLKAGLRRVDDLHPILVTGTELIRFHADRAFARRRPLKTGQFKCNVCRTAVYPDVETVSFKKAQSGPHVISARCPDCSGHLMTFGSDTDCDVIEACRQTNTPLRSLDEEDSAITGGIGNVGQLPRWTAGNERLLHQFLTYGPRYHPRTMDAIMTAVRDLEAFLDRKAFVLLKPKHIAAWRNDILARGKPGAAEPLSRSTIRHHASHVRCFLKWLIDQDGCRRLNRSLSDITMLPKGESAALLQPPPAPYPTLAEGREMVAAMPTISRTDRRNQAVVASAFLFALRAGTLASLRFRDIDVEVKEVRVDASKSRVKNGQSLHVFWFPVGREFEDIVIKWLDELRACGAQSGDALFPPDAALEGRSNLLRHSDEPILPWASNDAIGRAFTIASAAAGLLRYTPHAARHCIAELGKTLCRTEAAREAWSKNLGHSKRQITESHYAKMTPARRKVELDRLRRGEIETEAEKDLLLMFHEHRLVRGTAEFEQAEKLHAARMERLRD